jgi:hypothetical protein
MEYTPSQGYTDGYNDCMLNKPNKIYKNPTIYTSTENGPYGDEYNRGYDDANQKLSCNENSCKIEK